MQETVMAVRFVDIDPDSDTGRCPTGRQPLSSGS